MPPPDHARISLSPVLSYGLLIGLTTSFISAIGYFASEHQSRADFATAYAAAEQRHADAEKALLDRLAQIDQRDAARLQAAGATDSKLASIAAKLDESDRRDALRGAAIDRVGSQVGFVAKQLGGGR